MLRITHRMMASTIMQNIRKNLSELDDINYKIGSGRKLKFPSDDPVGNTRSIMLRSSLYEIEQYKRNMVDAQNQYRTIESALSSATQIIQRIRELTIQAANGTYAEDERKAIAYEVEQLQEDLLRIANTTFEGRYIFGGYRSKTRPFQVTVESRDGIERVSYFGDIGDVLREIERDTTLKVNVAGDAVFYAGRNTMVSGFSANNPNAPIGVAGSGTLYIDKTPLNYTGNETLSQLAQMINDLQINVEASVSQELVVPLGNLNPDDTLFNQGIYPGFFHLGDTVVKIDKNTTLNSLITKINSMASEGYYAYIKNGNLYIGNSKGRVKWQAGTTNFTTLLNNAQTTYRLVLESTEPHKIHLQDTTGNMLTALNFQGGFEKGKNVFELLTQIRSHLLHNDAESLSTIDLADLDKALDNILLYRAVMGAKANRLEVAMQRMEDKKLYTTDVLSKTEDVDLAEEIAKLRTIEYVHQASLAVSARIARLSLVDFLR